VGPELSWLEQSTHNRLVVGSSPTEPNISHEFCRVITALSCGRFGIRDCYLDEVDKNGIVTL
jgi:hypothetical protein